MRIAAASIVLAGVSVLFSAPLFGAVTFSDGDFAGSSYDMQVIEGGFGGRATLTFHRDGGNPGSFLAVRTDIAAGVPTGGFCANWVWPFIFIDGATLDPIALGGIKTIDFSIDAMPMALSRPGNAQSQTPALRQNGKLYISIVGGGVAASTPGWTTYPVAGLRSQDFVEVVNLPACTFADGTSHPDFSRCGAHIDLGFARGNSTSIGGNDTASFTEYGADNWTMTVHECDANCCSADFNGDGNVDAIDLGILLGAWGSEDCEPNLDGIGNVDAIDIAILLGQWGDCQAR